MWAWGGVHVGIEERYEEGHTHDLQASTVQRGKGKSQWLKVRLVAADCNNNKNHVRAQSIRVEVHSS